MRCTDFREISSAYIDKLLSQDELERFEAHLQSCSVCGSQVEALKKVQSLLGDLEPPSLPTYFKTLLDAQIESKNKKSLSARFKELFLDLTCLLLQVTKRDVLIALLCLPITWLLFSAMLSHLYMPRAAKNSHPVQLTIRSRAFELPSRAGEVNYSAPPKTRLPLTPAKISNVSLADFAQSAHESSKDDSFMVLTHVNKYGKARIEKIIEYPQEYTWLKKFDSLITSVKFQPAKYNGKAVDSHLILIFNTIMVSS